MDFTLFIRHRLTELETEQRALAAAAGVTESYISQLLTGKKTPPAPGRTDIYDRMEAFLRLPAGKLATLADLQRNETVRSKLAAPPVPLFAEVRALTVHKCYPGRAIPIRALFAKEPFGLPERLVTQALLDVAGRAARMHLNDEGWLRRLARTTDRSDQRMRGMVLDFLETNIFNVSADHCVAILDPLIDGWDIDLATFAMKIVLNQRLAPGHAKRFHFVERDDAPPVIDEPGLRAFRQDGALGGDATDEEVEWLKRLTFSRRRPTRLFYYRTLQALRDPIHFCDAPTQRRRGEGRRPDALT